MDFPNPIEAIIIITAVFGFGIIGTYFLHKRIVKTNIYKNKVLNKRGLNLFVYFIFLFLAMYIILIVAFTIINLIQYLLGF